MGLKELRNVLMFTCNILQRFLSLLNSSVSSSFQDIRITMTVPGALVESVTETRGRGGGALSIIFGGYVPLGAPNPYPVPDQHLVEF